MNGAVYVGAIGLQTQQQALDAIANNIANMNTSGFKRTDVRFAEVMASRSDPTVLRADLSPDATSMAGVRLDALMMLDEPGELQRTDRAMDLAIEGRGFIELMGPDGQTLLWRGGALKVNEDGMLATVKGIPLRAAITVPSDVTGVEIGADGVVRATSAGEGAAAGEPVELGQIDLVMLGDSGQVERLDGGIYRVRDGATLPDARPGEDGAGRLVQGAVERSNVEMTDEMVRLMLVQRSYAANAQVLQAADQLMGMANGLRR